MPNTLLTFDNLPDGQNAFPTNLKGFSIHPNDQNQVGYYDVQGFVGGYGDAAVSGVNAGYFANSFSVTETDKKTFSGLSGYFTAGGSDSDTLLITGYRNGQEVKSREVVIGDTPTFINLRGFQNVNRLSIVSETGSEDAFDNLALHHHQNT